MELATLDESWQPTEIPPQPGSIIDLGLNFNPGELIGEHDKVISLHIPMDIIYVCLIDNCVV